MPTFGQLTVTAGNITEARDRIGANLLETPLIFSPQLSEQTSARCFLKLENRQHTGSFKARGAYNKVLSIALTNPDAHIITASTGNHGLGVARSLQQTGMQGTIYLPENASQAKIRALQNYPAILEFYGDDPLKTELHAKHIAENSGRIWVSPYNDPEIIAGQGTIGPELTAHLSDIAAVYITVGGGGLISGIGTWLAAHSPATDIIGCLPERSPEMALSVEAGRILHLEKAEETLSDGSAGGCEDGSITFPICQKLVDRFILVGEDEIRLAMTEVFDWHEERIEGSAGVAVAAMKRDAEKYAGKNVIAIICGGNRVD
jgi:threonine dehydratase